MNSSLKTFSRVLNLSKLCPSTQLTTKRHFIYSWKKGMDRDTISKLQQPIDFSLEGLRRWVKKKEWQELVESHRFIPEKLEMLGPDLATAHFVVAQNGSVKFEGFDKWFQKGPDGKYFLPLPSSDVKLEAVNVSNTDMMYESFDNFVGLEQLKYLNLSHCKYIDDWCLDRLVKFRDTLLVLDLSGCPNVSERGLGCLHKLHNLKRLQIHNMPNVRYAKLAALMLEAAIPDCIIEGVDYSVESLEEDTDPVPAFLKSWQSSALRKDEEKRLVAEMDGITELLKSDTTVKKIGH